MVALSASELDSKLKEQLSKAGFDDWFTVPLSTADIKDKIMSKLDLRSSLFMVHETD